MCSPFVQINGITSEQNQSVPVALGLLSMLRLVSGTEICSASSAW